jgi:hypothetical protein
MERNELKEKLKEFLRELEKDDVDVEEINNKIIEMLHKNEK